MKSFKSFVREEYGELSELSSNTLGSYAKKAHNRGEIAARMTRKTGDEMDKIADKRSKGAALAAKKLGKKAGDKSTGTRTANNIEKSISHAKTWRTDNSAAAKKTLSKYDSARKGIGKLWDKASKRG